MAPKTIYLVTQLAREENEVDIREVFKRVANSGVPVSFSRIFHAATSGPTRTAAVIADYIGEKSGNDQEKRFYVTNKGALKGDTVIPTREDLSKSIQSGDRITFDLPEGMAADDVEASKYQPLEVINVYKESVEVSEPLKYKISGKMCFYISTYNRAVKTSHLDISSRLKGTVGFMRHQQEGSIFVMTKGDLVSVIPIFFNQEPLPPVTTKKGAVPPPSLRSPRSKQVAVLVDLLKTHSKPWLLQLSFNDDGVYLPDPSTLSVYWSTKGRGGVIRPFQSSSRCQTLLSFLFILLVFVVLVVGVVGYSDHPSIAPVLEPVSPLLQQLKVMLQPVLVHLQPLLKF